MAAIRKPLQGVYNILRFNWHFYLLSVALSLGILFLAGYYNSTSIQYYLHLIAFATIGITVISLLVSCYIYDLSGLYQLNWLPLQNGHRPIVNIHAGFDETSTLVSQRYMGRELIVLDFYDPEKHTEISIKRARKANPPFPGTRPINTTTVPLADGSADHILIIFAAHEIRNEQERIAFFRELRRILTPTGQIIVTEHLRDPINFLAYTVGFFHFYSKASWHKTFRMAGLSVHQELKITPFISTFILTKHGNTF